MHLYHVIEPHTGINRKKELIMKTKQLISFALLSTFVVSGCSDNKATATKPEADAAMNHTAINADQVTGAKFFVGALAETFNAGGYTYARLSTSDGEVWAAGPVTALKEGDKVSFASKMLMKNFTSKSTQRDFKEIYFVKAFTVNGIRVGGMPMASMSKTSMPKASMVDTTQKNPHKNASNQQTNIKLKPIKKAAKGQDIAEIIAKANTLRDKTVTVRGQVTKVTSNILGANWLHIRDSSTKQDLIVTTSDSTKTGDIILVKGKLALNKDFGKGFVIGRVIADANVKVE